jgi:hypothetical protein
MVKQVALIAAGALIIALFLFADLWLSSGLGLPFVLLTAAGLLAVAVILGSLWRDRLPVRILRRSLIVLALLALILGTGTLALEWLGVFPSNTGRFFSGPTGQRAISVLFVWPLTGFFVWLLGAMALLARRRFGAAAVYTLSAFAAIVVIAAVVVVIPAWVPFFAPVGLVNAPGWVGALCFLALDAAVVYVAWTRLFDTDFLRAPTLPSPARRGEK